MSNCDNMSQCKGSPVSEYDMDQQKRMVDKSNRWNLIKNKKKPVQLSELTSITYILISFYISKQNEIKNKLSQLLANSHPGKFSFTDLINGSRTKSDSQFIISNFFTVNFYGALLNHPHRFRCTGYQRSFFK